MLNSVYRENKMLARNNSYKISYTSMRFLFVLSFFCVCSRFFYLTFSFSFNSLYRIKSHTVIMNTYTHFNILRISVFDCFLFLSFFQLLTQYQTHGVQFRYLACNWVDDLMMRMVLVGVTVKM